MLARWGALHARLAQGRRLQQVVVASGAAAVAPFSSSSAPRAPSAQRSPYDILGVAPSASSAEIKAAFRRQAMRLHPDRLQGSQDATASDFLELAEAFEALSDPARRRALDDATRRATAAQTTTTTTQKTAAAAQTHSPYDASDPSYDERELPPFLQRWFESERRRREREREARAAAARASPLPWPLSLAERWFVGDAPPSPESEGSETATTRPDALDPRSAEAVRGALARCRAALQDELHSALMLAFFGPKAPRRGLPPGGLPRAFEAEERSDPKATPELLHLVSGRTLLGVVRERRPPLIEAGGGDGDGVGFLPAAVPLDLALPPPGGDCSPAAPAAAPPDPRQVLREVLGEEGDGVSWTPDQEAEVLARLDAPHALRGAYDWIPAPADLMLGGQRGSLLAMPPLPPLLTAVATDGDSDATALTATTSTRGGEDDDDEASSLGARRRRQLWEEATAQRAREKAQQPRASVDGDDDPDDDPFLRPTAAELALRRARALAAAHASAERARRRRWRRLVAAPAPDWKAEEWAFDELTPGVTVLELALTPGPAHSSESGVVAVGVRHEDPWALRELGMAAASSSSPSSATGEAPHLQQRGRFGSLASGLLGAARLPPPPAHAVFPLKVFVGGRFVAACLDDVIMEPHTGDLLCAVYRMATPGVNHLWFSRVTKPAPRLLCRVKRGWLPPSGTWLFQPRAPGTHDTGGWYVEAEGPPGSGTSALARPGYIHPSVFSMVAAFASLDAERRREQKASEARERRERWFGGWGWDGGVLGATVDPRRWKMAWKKE